MIKANSFRALEATLKIRLKASLRSITAPIYEAVKLALDAEDWARAEEHVQRISLSTLTDGHMEFLEYVTNLAMLFGASRVTSTPGTTVVGLGFEKLTTRQMVMTLEQSLKQRGEDNLKSAGLQLIALHRSLSATQDTVHKANPYHDEAGRFSTGDRAKFVSIGPAFSSSHKVRFDIPGIDPALAKAVKKTILDLVKEYPQAAGLSVTDSPIPGVAAWTWNNGIVLSSVEFTPEKLAAFDKDLKGCFVDTSPEGIMTHEFGHYLANVADRKVGFEEVRSKLDGFYRDSDMLDKPPSVYGQESAAEYQAESFSLAHRLKKGKGVPDGVYPDAKWAAEAAANAKKVNDFIQGAIS